MPRIRRLALAGMLALTMFPVLAQAQGCEIDLLDQFAVLARAQGSADGGFTDEALGDIASVRDTLTGILEACAGDIAPVEVDGLVLSETYIEPQTGIAVPYPAGWGVSIGRDEATYIQAPGVRFDEYVFEPVDIPPGERAILVQLVEFVDGGLTGALEQLQEATENEEALFTLFETIDRDLTVADYPAVRMRLIGDALMLEGTLIDTGTVTSDGEQRLLFVVVLASPDAVAGAVALMDALLPMIGSAAETSASAPAATVTLPGYDDMAVSGGTPLGDLLDGSVRVATLSPDGERIAYLDGNVLCVYTLAGSGTACAESEARLSAPRLHWSPDSRYIAWTGDLYLRLYEPDLWLLDVQTMTMTNLTDDLTDDVDLSGEERGSILDVAVVWEADSQTMLLYRAEPAQDAHGFYRIGIDGSAAVKVADLLPVLGDRPSIDYNRMYALDGTMTLSTDGTRLAFSVPFAQDEVERGLYITDLTTGETEQVMSAAALDGLLQPERSGARPFGMAWDAAGAGLFLNVVDGRGLLSEVAYFDVATQVTTPLVDIAGMSDEAFAALREGDDIQPIQRLIALAVTPARDGLVAVGFGDESLHLFRLRPANGTWEHEELLQTPRSEAAPFPWAADVGANGNILLYSLLYTP
jgi:hypothetical protein